MSTANYGSKAGIFQAAGIPTIICGPGRDTEAHITRMNGSRMEDGSRFVGFMDPAD